MIRKKTIVRIVSLVVGLFLLLPLIGVGVLKWAVLPPERLTPLVIEQANSLLKATLECEKVELTYLETFPYLGAKLTNGHLVSRVSKDSLSQDGATNLTDSLLTFQTAIVELKPTDYLFKGMITVPKILLDDFRFYGYVDGEGRANWEIYESEKVESPKEPNLKPLPKLKLERVAITNGHFVYKDLFRKLYTDINGFFLQVNGSFNQYGNDLDVETGSSSIVFESPSYSLENEMAIRFSGRLLVAERLQGVELKDAELLVDKLPFSADGLVLFARDKQPTQVDISFGLKVDNMSDILSFIPEKYLKNKSETLAKGRVVVESKVQGEFRDDIVPSVNLCCKIDEGAFHIKGIEHGIDSLDMDLDITLDGLNPDSSFISLRKLNLVGLNTSLDMTGKLWNIWKNPSIDANLNGVVDFTRLGKTFLNPDTLLLQGAMLANLSTSFQMDDLLHSRFGKVKSAGNLKIDHFKAYSKSLGIDAYISGLDLFVGSKTKKNEYLNLNDLLTSNLTVDTLNILYKDQIKTTVGGLNMTANTAPVVDTSAVIPLTADVRFNNLSTKLPDSIWVVAGQTILKGGIKPSAKNKKIPVAGALISIDTLRYALIPLRTGVVLESSEFYLEALPHQSNVIDEKNKSEMDIKSDSTKESSSVLNTWDLSGGVKFNSLRGFSRLFPIPMKIDATSMKFNTDRILLNDARMSLGNSDLVLSGEIEGVRKSLMKGDVLKGEFELKSEEIDCNQLIQAMAQGTVFSEQQLSYMEESVAADSLLAMNAEDVLKHSVDSVSTDSLSGLFVVPKILDLTLNMNAEKILFKDLKLERVTGKVIVRDQSVNLSDLSMVSNIGSGGVTMVYTAKDKQESTMGFEMSVKDIMVDRLIDLFPNIDTLVPMLRSFEGLVDCQMTATCKTDSTMSVLLPTVNASCFLSGKNMVLLDGETFTEISKTLRFKNKKRNMIDSIAVDVSIHDNQIEVFPFLVEMDRYKVAVGGTHNLDMTFNYHLSVLKSPIPLKIGIDIKGNLDDFKFKIVRCKYKDFLKPAKQAELDSTRRNVREDIRNAIRKQIRESAPELDNSLSGYQWNKLDKQVKGKL